MLDIVLLSYNEPLADAAWDDLRLRTPWASRIDGVEGILNAHKAAAKQANTECFYVVDADAVINDTFDFSYQPPKSRVDFVHVWRSENPINGLTYGYGGLKLFPRKAVLEVPDGVVDFTTTVSKNFQVMDEVASISRFNVSAFDTWKSAFRECVKLSSSIIDREDEQTKQRLDIWCTIGEEQMFGKECIHGANEGRAYGSKHKDNKEMLMRINDYKWLRERFENGQ